MKRTLFQFAIVAGLMAATFSTAFAGGGFKFGGSLGGNSGGSRPSMSRNITTTPRISLGGNSGGNQGSNGLGSIQKFQPQIKKINGNSAGHGAGISGIHLNQGGNSIQRIPGLSSSKPLGNSGIVNKLPINGSTINTVPKIGIDPKFGQDKKVGIQIGGNQGIQIGKQGGISIGNGGIQIGKHENHGGNAAAHCLPGDKHCHKNLLNWCDPHHWPSYKPCYPCHKPICYHETVYVYTQPIVIPVAVPVEKLLQVPAGATLTLQAPNLGDVPGQVVLQMEKVAMAGLVREWKLDTVTASLPPMELAAPVIAEILILRADGSLANGIKIELIPAQPDLGTAAAPQAGLDAASQAAAALGM